MTERRRRRVVCFGECLWDSLPAGLFPGGAPLNVAVHLRRLGLDVVFASAVGNDVPGEELLSRLREWGLPDRFVAVVEGSPTGLARVRLVDGVPSFRIDDPAAWDAIEASPALLDAASAAEALVFGSLALRRPGNRAQLARVLDALPRGALRVLDLNLRPPFDEPATVQDAIGRAQVLKLNADELARVAGIPVEAAGIEGAARAASKRTGCSSILVTAGGSGAGMLSGGSWSWEPARAVEIADTVGAGDAFLAMALSRLLEGDPPAEILRRACRLGEFVASRPGALPPFAVGGDGVIRDP